MEKIKNYLKLGSLLFGILLANLSCQKDDFDDVNESTKERRIQRISLAQFETKMYNSKNYSKLSKLFDIYKNNNDVNYKTLQSTDSLYLITDNIIMIDNQDIISYTFKINSNSTNLFYNLVLDTDSNGNILSSSIIEYTPSFDWINNSSLPFTGTAEIYENDIFSLTSLSNLMSSRSSDDCLTGVSGHWECNWGEEHAPGEGTKCTSWDYIIDLSYGPCDSSNNISYEYSFGGADDADEYSGGGDGGGAGSSTSPNVTVDEDLISDCNLLENLSASPDFSNKMQELINNTSGNTEIAYFGSTDNSGNTSLPIRVESPEGVRGIDAYISSNEQVDVFMHNHFNNGQGSLSVFSGSDLYTLYQLYLNGNITDTDNYVMVVATPGGNGSNDQETVYAITINNEVMFAQFGATFLHDHFLIDNLYNTDDNLISPNISNALNELRFTKLLNYYNSGLTVFKGDKDNLSNWTKLKINRNNTITENNCN